MIHDHVKPGRDMVRITIGILASRVLKVDFGIFELISPFLSMQNSDKATLEEI